MRLYTKRQDREDWWREGLAADQTETGSEGKSPQGSTFRKGEPPIDWVGLSEQDDEGSTARHDVPLALMLMVGASPWQRIDGMGIARQALESPVTSDDRRDLTDAERLMLANGRAWCHAVHADLSPNGKRDDPIILVDASRYAQLAFALGPREPEVGTTQALISLRQGRVNDAMHLAHGAVETFGSFTDRQRSGQAHGSAVLAVLTLALATAAAGDHLTAFALGSAARATRTAIDVDETSFAALLAELSDVIDRQQLRMPGSGTSSLEGLPPGLSSMSAVTA